MNNNNNHHCNSRLYHSPSLNMNPHNNNYNGLTYTHSYINNNTSPLEANDLQYHKHKPTFDYITDIKQIDEELLSPNTTQYTSSKRIQYTKQNNNVTVHNKLNSSNYSLKIDDCSDIERNSSFINVNKPLSLKSPSLSKLTTSKINKYFHNSLMNKLHYDNNSDIERKTSSPFYGRTNNIYESIFISKRQPHIKPLSTEESNNGMNITTTTHHHHNNNNNHMMIDDNALYCKTNEDVVQSTIEENKYLKNVINSYKKLLDSLFYFVNSLSHKYSFNKPFYQMNHYINNEDELTKELLALDKCLQNNINVSLVEFQKQELLNKLVVTQEVSVTLSAALNEKENNELYVYSGDNNNNMNVKCSSNINNYYKESNRYKKNIGATSMSSIRQNSKDSKECVACMLGASISKRGYSPMKFNPYKTFNSSKRNNNALTNRSQKSIRSTSH